MKLNVGGALFQTTLATLTKQDTMLRAMFSGRMDVSFFLNLLFILNIFKPHDHRIFRISLSNILFILQHSIFEYPQI